MTDLPTTSGLGFAQDGIRGRNVAPSTLLWMAFGVQPDQIVDIPSWATSERFNITAKVPTGQMFDTKLFGPMVQNLLADRFQLKTHHETRELNAYRLVRLSPDRLGPKIAQAAADACDPPAHTDADVLRAAMRRCAAGPNADGVSVHGMGIATLTSFIGPQTGRVVVDATGLTGNWDLDLTFVNPVQTPDRDGPSLFTAVQEQLGLKLEAGRFPVDVIVVDHLERPTED